MRDSLFEGLPPPAISREVSTPVRLSCAAPGPSVLASSTTGKRTAEKNGSEETKRVRFKENESELSEQQVLGAMGKIAAHISNPGKFSKASKLAVQLLRTGSVTSDTADAFFEILKAAMGSPSDAIDVKAWADYQALFRAVMEKLECFGSAQQAQIEVWELWAVLANEFRTDDTFVFSKASARVRQSLDSLTEASEDESTLEEDGGNHQAKFASSRDEGAKHSLLEVGNVKREIGRDDIADSDPFGLNALIPRRSKKEERARRRKDEEAASLQVHKNATRLLRDRREALVACLKVAADQYRLQWAQTIIDILVKHAFDSISKFTLSQRHAVEQLWCSVRDQLVRRKQGKATSGKLDVTAFEHLQSWYAQEHISIRRAVGSSGERSAEQWLG